MLPRSRGRRDRPGAAGTQAEPHVQRLVSASFIDDLFPGNLFFNATVAYADDKMDLGIRSIAKNMYTVIVGVLVSHELKRCAE
jgi:hypothetical protein